MKRAISLNEVLNGNHISKKVKLKGTRVKDAPAKGPETIDLSNSPEKTDPDTSRTNQPKIVPVGDNVANVSVKAFLMMKPPRINKQIKNGSKTLGLAESTREDEDQLSMQEVINLENENFAKLINPKRLTQPTSNVKKTNLKELFASMRKNGNNDGVNTGDDKYCSEPFKRFNSVSKLDSLSTPLPHIQLIESLEPSDTVNTKNNEVEFKQLHQRKSHVGACQYRFEPQEYATLKCKINDNLISSTIQTSIKNGTHITLWTELFKPHNINEVLLDTRLKGTINKWIINAFEKLKKPKLQDIHF